MKATKKANSAEVEDAISVYERASAKAKARGELLKTAGDLILQAKRGEIMIARQRAEALAGVSRSTMSACYQKMCRFPEYARVAALTPRHCKRPSRFFVNQVPGLADFLAALVIERSGLIKSRKAARVAMARFGLPARHKRALADYVAEVKRQCAPEILLATNPDAAKSRLLPAFGSMTSHIENFLEIVELDGSPSDALTVDTRSGRRQIIAMVDCFSRLTVAIVAPSESTDHFGRLFLKFNRLVGLPRVIRTDRGKGFTSVRTKHFLANMNIALDVVPPYSGERKPTVEGSAIRSVQGFLALEHGATGRNVAERTVLRGRLSMAARRGLSEKEILQVDLTDRELEAHVDQFLALEAERSRKEFGGLSSRGKIKQWLDAGGIVQRCEDEQGLFALLAHGGFRSVNKRGVDADGRTFISSKLGRLGGHQVEFRRDADPDQLVIFGTGPAANKFICVARATDTLDAEERRAEALEARAEFRIHARAIRQGARRLVRKLEGHSPAEILLSASTPRGEKLIAIPFGNYALTESAKGARAARQAPARTTADSDGEMLDRDARWERFIGLKAQNFEDLETDERLFLKLYPTTVEYKARERRVA